MGRTIALAACLWVVPLSVVGAWGLSSLAAGQDGEGRDVARLRQVITGRACLPDGSPAADAEVTSSAGGEAVTDTDGSFALAAELALDVESLEVTAVLDTTMGRSLTGKARVVPSALSGTTEIGRLLLSPSLNCQPRWLPTFGQAPGLDGYPFALAEFDDGSGVALYVGGDFETAGGRPASGIARWDGASWSGLGSGVNGSVQGLAVFDDGGGPALYACGGFTTAGGQAASRIAKWDGSGWSALGSGLSGIGGVGALVVHDDGGGPALYVGGAFTTAGGASANRVARWDGTSWSAVGSGMNNSVSVLAVFDDGNGPALYAGGLFTTAGAANARGVAKWDGSSWSGLGSGLDGSDVRALATFDDGNGPALYAGGYFTSAGTATLNNIGRWDGSSWSSLNGGMSQSSPVQALAVYDDGNGPALYAGGVFTSAGGVPVNHVAKWDGSVWAPLGNGVSGSVLALVVYEDGSGPALYAGGFFAGNIVRWNGTSWSIVGGGTGGGGIYALTVHDDGSGPALYAGGTFTTAGGISARRIARWNGSSWAALGNGVKGGGSPAVHALATFDDGGGPALYVGGTFLEAGVVATANRIAKWTGSSLAPLGSGLDGSVEALAAFDDGSGPALYAGGTFTSASGVAANRIAKWNGSSWAPLGTGMNDAVQTLTVRDDGSGPALHAGGDFAVSPACDSYLAKWGCKPKSTAARRKL